MSNNLISIYQALLTISVKGDDVVTLSNILMYIQNLIKEEQEHKVKKGETKKKENKESKDT